MVEFLGCEEEFKLVLYPARRATLLDKVILYPLDEKRLWRRPEASSWKQQAKLLGNQLPPKV